MFEVSQRLRQAGILAWHMSQLPAWLHQVHLRQTRSQDPRRSIDSLAGWLAGWLTARARTPLVPELLKQASLENQIELEREKASAVGVTLLLDSQTQSRTDLAEKLTEQGVILLVTVVDIDNATQSLWLPLCSVCNDQPAASPQEAELKKQIDESPDSPKPKTSSLLEQDVSAAPPVCGCCDATVAGCWLHRAAGRPKTK